MPMNVDDIRFLVGDDGEVLLCCGPFSVEVCDDAYGFPDFVESILVKLRNIETEMKSTGIITE